MKRVVIVGICLIAAVGYPLWKMSHNGQLGEKLAWALLQGVEAKHRQDGEPNQPVLIERINDSDYTVLGLPTTDGSHPRAWLIVNQETPGQPVKLLPRDASFDVTCRYVAELQERVKVYPAAAEFLESHCR